MALSTAIPGDNIQITTNRTTLPFWEAAKKRRLVVPRCGRCDHFRMPPTAYCPECQSTDIDWVELSGRGEVYSFAIVHGYPGMPDLLLVPAVVSLPDAGGLRIVSNVIDVDPADVNIGDPLAVDFHPIKDDWLLPVFRIASV